MKNKMKQINIVDYTEEKKMEVRGVGLLRDHEITAAAVCMCIDWGPALWRL